MTPTATQTAMNPMKRNKQSTSVQERLLRGPLKSGSCFNGSPEKKTFLHFSALMKNFG